MGKVRVLPEVLTRQIAAGEIVERPASVVKELVENSLDADARSIKVQVEAGGVRSVRVLDDGRGMSAEDAQLAFEHHATSKIGTLEDLQHIRTLGFRGEALPSIASVSRVRLRTADREAPGDGPTAGTELQYEAGKRLACNVVSWPGGTEILVEDLFFNVPARRKFLRTPATELGHISRLVTAYALAFPEVEFRLSQGNRMLVDVPAVATLRERAFQLFGNELLDAMAPLEHEQSGVRVSGLVSLPHEQRNSSNWLYLFVNRRLVRDRLMTYALRQAYRDAIPAAAYPVAVLFVDVDPTELDVNVHPTKSEIRFHRSQDVFRAVLSSVEQALLRWSTRLTGVARSFPLQTGRSSHPHGQPGLLERFQKRIGSANGRDLAELWLAQTEEPKGSFLASEGAPHTEFQSLEIWDPSPEAFPKEPSSPGADEAETRPALRPLRSVKILGQFLESFIVATVDDAILVIDQHVAHERILFERSLERSDNRNGMAVQRLLTSQTVELDPPQRAAAERLVDLLNANGFEVEWFGEATLLVRGVPALAPQLSAGDVIRSLLDEMTERDDMPLQGEADDRFLRDFRKHLAVSLACRAAVKVNTPLSEAKMEWMVNELLACRNPYTCPHGRPVVLKLTLEELLKAFQRI